MTKTLITDVQGRMNNVINYYVTITSPMRGHKNIN
jgi:hypothetical protein